MPQPLSNTKVYTKNKRWSDFVKAWKFEPGIWHRVRLFGLVWKDYRHVVDTKTGKKYYEYCHAWDPDTDQWIQGQPGISVCPCCDLDSETVRKKGERLYTNLIWLEEEENKPANPKPDWSPIYMMEMPKTLFQRILELSAVNKGHFVDDPQHGANIQIKFDPSAEAANMYAATMDDKNVALTPTQLAYVVTQKYANGTSKRIAGNGQLPGGYSYIRCVNTREDMVNGLERNGYYKKGGMPNTPSAAETQENFQKLDQVEEINLDQDPIPAPAHLKAPQPVVDEAPAPKPVTKAATNVVQPQAAATNAAKAIPVAPKTDSVANVSNGSTDLAKLAFSGCPSEFGKFASAVDCFTLCQVMQQCKSKTEATFQGKKPAAPPVQVADDDTI
jgi:hypothetical protein